MCVCKGPPWADSWGRPQYTVGWGLDSDVLTALLIPKWTQHLMGYRLYCHMVVVLYLSHSPLPILVFMLLSRTAQRPFKNHWSWCRGLYLGPYGIKEEIFASWNWLELYWGPHIVGPGFSLFPPPPQHICRHLNFRIIPASMPLLSLYWTPVSPYALHKSVSLSLLAHYFTLTQFRPLSLVFNAP